MVGEKRKVAVTSVAANTMKVRERFIIFTSEKVWINPERGGEVPPSPDFFLKPLLGLFWSPEIEGWGGSRKARVQTFSEKIFPLQMFTLESKKGWGAGV